MAEIRRCDGPKCSQQYVAQRPTSKYCSPKCRVAASVARKKNGEQPAPRIVPMAPSAGGAAVYDAARAKLEKANVLAEPAAVVALDIARRIGNATDSALPGLTKELSRLLVEALGAAASEGDKVDEMKERRDAKLARAAAG